MAKINIVAQNMNIYQGDGLDRFARTGEISAKHLVNAGAQGLILGHSEVGDSPETIHKKLMSLYKEKLPLNKLIVLVGESWDEFEKNKPLQIAKLMKSKCEIIFNDIPAEFLNQLILGYEPKWGSRGSGRDDMEPPRPEFISACIGEMREFIMKKYKNQIKPLFIYGGRSTPERTKQILSDENINGLILGSACNTVKKTLDIANTMKEVCGNRTKVVICNFKAYELPDSYEKYITELSKLSDDFVILLAPPYTDIYRVRKLVEEEGLLSITWVL
ncbi:triose-phosphate isomerase [Candidatus Woesearchaeota archaeon]|nr:triose-phosphate isomerase [Candidatus Woesearchaeota archaeon]